MARTTPLQWGVVARGATSIPGRGGCCEGQGGAKGTSRRGQYSVLLPTGSAQRLATACHPNGAWDR